MRHFVEETILLFCLMTIVFAGSFYLAQNMRYGSARDFYQHAVYELKKKNFDDETKRICFSQAKSKGYYLKIEMGEESGDYARVVLQYDINLPVFGKREYIMDGYVR